jgi:hypothetical protein
LLSCLSAVSSICSWFFLISGILESALSLLAPALTLIAPGELTPFYRVSCFPPKARLEWKKWRNASPLA